MRKTLMGLLQFIRGQLSNKPRGAQLPRHRATDRVLWPIILPRGVVLSQVIDFLTKQGFSGLDDYPLGFADGDVALVLKESPEEKLVMVSPMVLALGNLTAEAAAQQQIRRDHMAEILANQFSFFPMAEVLPGLNHRNLEEVGFTLEVLRTVGVAHIPAGSAPIVAKLCQHDDDIVRRRAQAVERLLVEDRARRNRQRTTTSLRR